MAKPPPRIFVVDDAPRVASSIADVLRVSGFSAVSFTDPVEALTAALAESPDLLMSDIYMAELSGIELASRLRSLDVECDILLFSGHPYAADLVDEARGRGHSFRFLIKPIPPTRLIHEVAAICRGIAN
jgi:DNA-binding NtrC family response regulator